MKVGGEGGRKEGVVKVGEGSEGEEEGTAAGQERQDWTRAPRQEQEQHRSVSSSGKQALGPFPSCAWHYRLRAWVEQSHQAA